METHVFGVDELDALDGRECNGGRQARRSPAAAIPLLLPKLLLCLKCHIAARWSHGSAGNWNLSQTVCIRWCYDRLLYTICRVKIVGGLTSDILQRT
jgi:hypothetical protein